MAVVIGCFGTGSRLRLRLRPSLVASVLPAALSKIEKLRKKQSPTNGRSLTTTAKGSGVSVQTANHRYNFCSLSAFLKRSCFSSSSRLISLTSSISLYASCSIAAWAHKVCHSSSLSPFNPRLLRSVAAGSKEDRARFYGHVASHQLHQIAPTRTTERPFQMDQRAAGRAGQSRDGDLGSKN